MKKIALLSIVVLLLSCTKQKGDLSTCGTIVGKYVEHGVTAQLKYFIIVEKHNQLFSEEVGLIAYNELKLYSSYCQ